MCLQQPSMMAVVWKKMSVVSVAVQASLMVSATAMAMCSTNAGCVTEMVTSVAPILRLAIMMRELVATMAAVPFQGCQECVDGEATPIDSDGDGINDCEEVPGCTDSTACNYDEAANASDGSCEYAADYYDCTGSCLNDADGDEICDELEIAGCQDEMACNYNVEATDAGDCDYAEEGLTVKATASLEKTATAFAAVRMFSTSGGLWWGQQ